MNVIFFALSINKVYLSGVSDGLLLNYHWRMTGVA